MGAVTEAAHLMRHLAEPAVPGESVKAAIQRAARKAGLSSGLGKRLWYGEARRIDADTMDQLRARAATDTQVLREALDARRQLLQLLAACDTALGIPLPNNGSEMAHAASELPRVAYRPLAGE